MLDLGELTRCHLLYQIQNRLLLDFANLYQLHAAQSRRSRNANHPLMVAEPLQPQYHVQCCRNRSDGVLEFTNDRPLRIMQSER